MVAGVYRITSRVIETLGRTRHDVTGIGFRTRCDRHRIQSEDEDMYNSTRFCRMTPET